MNPRPIGCSFAYVHQSGVIYELGRFGSAEREAAGGDVSLWSDYSHVEAIRNNLTAHVLASKINEQAQLEDWSFRLDSGVKSVLVFPVIANEVPVAVLSLMFGDAEELSEGAMIQNELLTLTTLIALDTEYIRRRTASLELASVPDLTDAEIQLIGLIARGFSNKQISQEQLVAVPTVKARVSALLKKFDAKNRRDLVAKTKHLL